MDALGPTEHADSGNQAQGRMQADPMQLGTGKLLWEPKVWGDLPLFEPDLDIVDGADGEESDTETAGQDAAMPKRELVLEERPSGLEIRSATALGRGAIITQCGKVAASVGMEPGTAILSINARSVEDVPTEEIRDSLHDGPLPVAVGVKSMLNLPRGKKMKSRSKDPVTLCTAHCRGSYRAVRDAVAQLGWKEVGTESRDSSVIWLEHSDPTDGITPVQTVTRLDAFLQMCRKAPLARCLNSWMEELPDEFTFVPETWVLPNDAAELEAAMAKGKSTYIAKPSAGTQGKGIVLGKRWSDFNDVVSKAQGSKDGACLRQEYVVQRYIAKPLLLDGLKFDMRIYVVVTSVIPLRAYLFKEGLGRFCTIPYQAPKDGNLKDVCMHLTNFSVNKQSKEFQGSEGLSNHDEGSKRSVSSVFWQIEQMHGVSAADLWHRIAELTANTLMAIRPGLLEYYVQNDSKRTKALHPFAPKGFQIIGMDILLDSELQPHLIELNANPSLSVVQPSRNLASSRNDVETPPVAESPPPEVAVGSALQAVRMASRTDENQSNSTSPRPAEIVLDEVEECHRVQTILRIAQKLEQLSSSELKNAEAYIDSLRSENTSESTQGTSMREQSTLPRRTSASPDQPPRIPVKQANETAEVAKTSAARLDNSPSATTSSVAERGRRSASTQSKQRLGLSKVATQEKPKEKLMVVSPLDLEIKRELIVQALLLAKPAPQNKVARLRKQWLSVDQEYIDIIALDDNGAWLRTDCSAENHPEVRLDAPERCPCLEPLDFDELVIPDVAEYARAHFALYRAWLRTCGPGQSSVGQAQMLKLLERRGFVGAGQLFPERIAVQLWLTRVWRTAADGAFGLDITQFVCLCSRLGAMLRVPAGTEAAEVAADIDKVIVGGVLEFVRRGGAGTD